MSIITRLFTNPPSELNLGWQLIAICILSLMIPNICRSMYRAINSPFPGPKLAKFTKWWFRWHELRDGVLNATHRAHQNYGPVVQLAPKWISFCHPDAIKDIYNGRPRGGLDATDLVWFFERYGAPNVVSTVDAELHLLRRKNVAGLYSNPAAALPPFKALTRTTIDTFMNEIKVGASPGQPPSWTVDMFPMMRWLTADIMIGLTYGPERSLNLLTNHDSRAQMNELLTPTMELVASPLATVFQWLPFPIMKLFAQLFNPGPNLAKFGLSLVQESLRAPPPQYNDDDGKANTHLQHLLRLFKKNGPSPAIPNVNYIASDTLDHFSGGTTTTADFLSALLYHLSLPENKHHQDKLRQELRAFTRGTSSTTSTEHIPLSRLQTLPYLNGVLRETLRISPPIPFSLPRVVKTKDQDVSILGMKIDPGTTISIQPYTLHRDPETFPNPDVWDPERWQIPITSPAHRQMQRMFMPFGYGQRMCTGMSIAWAIMRQVTARLYIEYETSLDEGVWFEEEEEEAVLASEGGGIQERQRKKKKKKNLFPDGSMQPIVFRRV